MSSDHADARVTTGVPGLDEVLHGGFPELCTFLVKGGVGTGKTTLGLQFLLEGARRGEKGLFISLAQGGATLHRIARAHGWSLDGVEVHGITPHELTQGGSERQDVLVPDEVELLDLTDRVRRIIRDTDPDRLVFDSLGFVQIVSSNPVNYRRELVDLIEYLTRSDITSILTINANGVFEASAADIAVDGILSLHSRPSEFTGQRLRLRVEKLRTSDFIGGWHDFKIVTGGVRVFPRLVPSGRAEIVARERFSSGIGELDELVGGGLAAGTSTMIVGPSGSGKTSLAAQYVHAAAQRGSRSAIFLFEEVRETFLRRVASLGMDMSRYLEDGTLSLAQVEGSQVSPGEFAIMVRDAVDDGAEIVVIDSLTGYFQSMPGEEGLLAQFRELLRHLDRREVMTMFAVSQRGLVGEKLQIPQHVIESADTVFLLRYFEAHGQIRKALSVVKKRYGVHDVDIRELVISEDGVQVGPSTSAFVGILSGSPQYVGERSDGRAAPEGDASGGGEDAEA